MTISLATLVADSSALLAEGAPAGGGLMQLLPIVLMFAVIYFIVLRPMSKQEKDRKKRVEAIKKGDQIVLTGGILGRISSIDDTIAVVEIADKVKIRVLKKELVDLRSHVEKTDKDKADKDKKSDKKDASSKDGKSDKKSDKDAKAAS